ncbi:hypothetical protein T492DRAFT_985287, partial [Pavlovales sp. CCMP2436]
LRSSERPKPSCTSTHTKGCECVRHAAPHRHEEHDAETNATTNRVHYSPPGQGTHRAARPQEVRTPLPICAAPCHAAPHRATLHRAALGVGPSSRSTNDTPAQAQAQAPRIRHRALLRRQLGPRTSRSQRNPHRIPGREAATALRGTAEQQTQTQRPQSESTSQHITGGRNLHTYNTPHHSPRMPVNQLKNSDAARTKGALWEPAPARPLETLEDRTARIKSQGAMI